MTQQYEYEDCPTCHGRGEAVAYGWRGDSQTVPLLRTCTDCRSTGVLLTWKEDDPDTPIPKETVPCSPS